MGRRILFLALMMGFLAALATHFYLRERERTIAARLALTRVLVATKYIPRWTKVDASMVAIKTIPAEFVQPSAISGSDEKRMNELFTELSGQLAMAPIMEGEQILVNKFTSAGSELSAMVSEGKRVVAIAVDGVSGVSGLLKPGNFVDVLGTFQIPQAGGVKNTTITLLQNVLVMAVGENTVKGGAETKLAPKEIDTLINPLSTVSLAVSPQEAELIAFAEENGKIKLALRPAGDNTVNNLSGISFNTLFKIEEKVKVVSPPRPASPQPSIGIIRGTEEERVPLRGK